MRVVDEQNWFLFALYLLYPTILEGQPLIYMKPFMEHSHRITPAPVIVDLTASSLIRS